MTRIEFGKPAVISIWYKNKPGEMRGVEEGYTFDISDYDEVVRVVIT